MLLAGPLPLPLSVDIVEANMSPKAAGRAQEYDAMDMRRSTEYPPATQVVFHLFNLEGARPLIVAVGVRYSSVCDCFG